MRFAFLVVLFLSIEAYSKFAPYPAFKLLPTGYKKASPCTEAKNLPPLIDQDGLPICQPCVAANIFKQYKCTTENLDCKNLNNDEIPGTLGLAGIMREKSNSFNPIPFLDVPNSLSSPSAVIGTSYNRGVASESCFPFDQFIAKHKGRSEDVRKIFNKYLEKFNAIQGKTEGEICVECLLNDLKVDFGVSPDLEAIKTALKDRDFEGFIGDLVLSGPRCKLKKFKPRIKMDFYPGDGKAKPAYTEYMNRIDSVLSENQVAGADICLSIKDDSKRNSKCKDGHSVTLVGKCTFCNSSGNCREALHVMNSWGKEWQDENHDGWVDAENLYSYFATEGVSLSHPKLKK